MSAGPLGIGIGPIPHRSIKEPMIGWIGSHIGHFKSRQLDFGTDLDDKMLELDDSPRP